MLKNLLEKLARKRANKRNTETLLKSLKTAKYKENTK